VITPPKLPPSEDEDEDKLPPENCWVTTPESVLVLQVTGAVSIALFPQTLKLRVQSALLVSVKLMPASVGWKISPETDLVRHETSWALQSAFPPPSLQLTVTFSVPLHGGVPTKGAIAPVQLGGLVVGDVA
jgi:hypothetical protein